jgi:hypothetical protein
LHGLIGIVKCIGWRGGKRSIHPATKTFQALRIYVNDELTELKKGLSDAEEILNEGGLCIAVSFHSLEDRIVKKSFRACSNDEDPSFTTITKSPIIPDEVEQGENPQSRSAKLRIAMRTSAPSILARIIEEEASGGGQGLLGFERDKGQRMSIQKLRREKLVDRNRDDDEY